jgi:hypothetical protein
LSKKAEERKKNWIFEGSTYRRVLVGDKPCKWPAFIDIALRDASVNWSPTKIAIQGEFRALRNLPENQSNLGIGPDLLFP